MSTALGLAMQISANTAQLAKAVQDVNSRLDSMSNAGKKAASDLGVLKNIEIGKLALGGIQALTSALASIGSAAASAVSSMISFGKSVADEIDRLNDISKRTGVAVEALQAYGHAANLAGISSESFAKALQKLTINIGQAVGDEKAQKAFTDLGLAFEELRARSPAEQFEMIADALAKISDPAERAAKAVEVFGKGGIELGPLFTDGPGAMKAMREEAEKLGMVVSSEGVSAIAQMNDAIDKMYAVFKGIVAQVVSKLAPAITEIAENILSLVGNVGGQNIADTFARVLLDALEYLAKAFIRFAQFIEKLIEKIGPYIGIELRPKEQIALDAQIAQLEKLVASNISTAGMQMQAGYELRKKFEEEQARINNQLHELYKEREEMITSAGSTLEDALDQVTSAIDAARESINRRSQQPDPPSASDVINVNNNFSDDDIVRELKYVNQKLELRTVDIYGG